MSDNLFCAVTQIDYGEVEITDDLSVRLYGYAPQEFPDVMIFAVFREPFKFLNADKPDPVVLKRGERIVYHAFGRLVEFVLDGREQWPPITVVRNDYRVKSGERLMFNLGEVKNNCLPSVIDNRLVVHDQIVGDLSFDSWGPHGRDCEGVDTKDLAQVMPNPALPTDKYLMYNKKYNTHLKWGLYGVYYRLYYDQTVLKPMKFVPREVSNPTYPFVQYGDSYSLNVDTYLVSDEKHARGMSRDNDMKKAAVLKILGAPEPQQLIGAKRYFSRFADCPSVDNPFVRPIIGKLVCCKQSHEELWTARKWRNDITVDDSGGDDDQTAGYIVSAIVLLFFILVTVYIVRNVQ